MTLQLVLVGFREIGRHFHKLRIEFQRLQRNISDGESMRVWNDVDAAARTAGEGREESGTNVRGMRKE